MGNRTQQTAPAGTTTYTYDANNRLTQAGATTYTYGANDNLTSISTGRTFAWADDRVYVRRHREPVIAHSSD